MFHFLPTEHPSSIKYLQHKRITPLSLIYFLQAVQLQQQLPLYIISSFHQLCKIMNTCFCTDVQQHMCTVPYNQQLYTAAVHGYAEGRGSHLCSNCMWTQSGCQKHHKEASHASHSLFPCHPCHLRKIQCMQDNTGLQHTNA